MTAANVMDVIARLPDCDGQVADAISADTQVKMKDVPKLLKKSEVRMSRHMETSSTTQMAEILASIVHPVVPPERNFFGRPSAGLLCERQFDKALLELGWEKVQIGNACSFIENTDYFYQFLWMTLKLLERSRIWLPC